MIEFDEDNADFGDLYTDVEVKAGRTLAKLLEEDEENLDSIEAEEVRDGNESESESEDGLNIVLNDDDRDGNFFDNNCEVNAEKFEFDIEVKYGVEEVDGIEYEGGGGGVGGVGYGAQFKLVKAHSQLPGFSDNVKSNVSAGAASCSTLVRGNWGDKSCGSGFSTGSIRTHSWRNFSLPRNRTILDVNIDALEWKPWRHPGVDITDFFNFGLDEDSWKLYCNHLDMSLGKGSEVNDNPASKPSRHTKQDKAECEQKLLVEDAIEVDTPSKLRTSPSPSYESSRDQQAQMPKGKAIQVKEGNGERQPSLGVRYPFERDADVIIQVPVQDIEADLTNSAKGAVDGRSSFVEEAYDNKESGDVDANDCGDVLCFGSASEDGLPSLEVSSEETHKSFPERSFKRTSCDDPACIESDDCGSLHVSEADENHQQETSDSYSDGSSEATRSSDNPKVDVSNVNAACRKDLDSNNAEPRFYSSSSSASQSHDLASRYGAYVEADKFCSRSKRESRNSVLEVQESVTHDYRSLKDAGSHGIKMKPGDPEYFARSRSPIQRNNKFHQKKSSRMDELKSYPEKQEALYVSDSEKFHDLPHPTFGRFIRRNRHQGFDYSKREDFLYDEGSQQSFYHGGKRFCDYPSSDAYERKSHRKSPLDSRYERDLPHRQIMDGKHYYTRKRMRRSNDDMLEHNLGRFVSRLSVEEKGFLLYDERRQFIDEQLPFPGGRNHTQRRRKLEELHFKSRRENNEFMPECSYSNEYTRENYGYVRNDTKERDVIHHKYDSSLPYFRREVESPVGSKWKFSRPHKVYGTIRHRDCEDKKVRHIGNRFNLFSKKNHAAGWGPSSRGSVFRRQGVQMRENCFERDNESNFGGSAEVFYEYDNIEYPDDQDNFGRRRLCLGSEVLHWREDKYSSWHVESDFPYERTWDPPLKRTLRSKRSDAKHEYGGKLIGFESEQKRCKQLRGGHNGSHFLQNSNFTPKDTLSGSWNSTENYMVVGNRKSSRCFEGGSLICNARYEYSDRNDHSSQRILEDTASFRKSPDIEEGQIIAQDFDEEPKEKTRSSKGSENRSCKNARILEVIAKMEKRLERFKQPLVNVSEKNGEPSAGEVAETADKKKVQRPARKRKWIAS